MKFVATKTADQLDLQALHRVRERLVSQRTGIINQIRAFLLERGIAVRQGQRFLRVELPHILATPPDVLSPRMVRRYFAATFQLGFEGNHLGHRRPRNRETCGQHQSH
jgi:transposase